MEQQHIIIADDEALLCLTLSDILRHKGFKVTIAHDGDEVLPIIEKEKTDLVLLDFMMPRMDGLKALVLIKERSPQTKVIMVSAFGKQQHVQKAQELGSDGFIEKPLGVGALIDYIKVVLAGGSPTTFHQPSVEGTE